MTDEAQGDSAERNQPSRENTLEDSVDKAQRQWDRSVLLEIRRGAALEGGSADGGGR